MGFGEQEGKRTTHLPFTLPSEVQRRIYTLTSWCSPLWGGEGRNQNVILAFLGPEMNSVALPSSCPGRNERIALSVHAAASKRCGWNPKFLASLCELGSHLSSCRPVPLKQGDIIIRPSLSTLSMTYGGFFLSALFSPPQTIHNEESSNYCCTSYRRNKLIN